MLTTQLALLSIGFALSTLFMLVLQTRSEAATNWRAHWIWCEGEPKPRNFYLYLRKTFDLPANAKSAHLLVSADSRYQLFVNGTFVSRGPARCDRRWQYYDEWDITPYLRAGRNVIAALVHHYGEWTFSYMLGQGGFICQADIVCKNGEKVQLQTDETWKVMPSKAWERRLPRMSIQLGFSEVYDARKAPEGWTSPEFDDSNWQQPVIIGKPPCEPWPRLVHRDIPAMRETLIYPAKVLEVGTLGKPVSSYSLHRLNFIRLFGVTNYAAAYAATYVWSPREGEFEIHAGSDDAIKLWVNDELVISHLVAHIAAPDQEITRVKLRPSWNKVLAKIVQQEGEWMFYFRFEGEGSPSLVYAAQPKEITTVSDSDIEAPWMVIGPFDSPDLKTGFETVYPPEQEISPAQWDDYTKKYSGKNGVKISWKSAGQSREMMPISILMSREERLPLGKVKVKNVDGLIQRRGQPAVIGHSENGVYVVIDFGKEVAGFPRIRIEGATGGEIIDLGYSEVLQGFNGKAIPPLSKKMGVVNPDRDNVHYADRYICKLGDQEFQTYDKRAFRYLQINVRNVRKPLNVGPVSLLFSTYPVKYRGSFECSDKRLNKIWGIGRYTVQLNMEDGYTDCPWRERGQWWGDARIEALCNYYAFGDLKLIRKALKQKAQSQNEEGMTWGVYPTDWDGARLPTFTLIWVYTIWDYYLFSADKELVQELFPNVQKALEFFEKHLNANNLLNNVPYWNFVDWAKVETKGEATAVNCFYYRALTAAAQLAEVLGDKESVVQYSALAEKVRQAINAHLWDSELSVYHDARLNGLLIDKVSQQANSLAIVFDVAPREQWSKILDYIHDSTKTVVQSGSPYFSFYVLEAMYKAGRYEQALQYIRKRWGEMLDWGATTWWENWQPAGSFCHGWSSAPTHNLPAEFLGVKPTAPGWTEIEIKPHPVDLKWAKGIVPTLNGDVRVEWHVTSNRSKEQKAGRSSFEMSLEIPSRCSARVFVPLAGKGIIKVNGQIRKLPKDVARLTDEEGYARFEIRGRGEYKFDVK